ncbi:MAG TPA: serine/threonine protein kinase [Phycisphaerales bacterium]|nr:serine/threonine protein kinase [Phycisphaerales bacterium]|tara:strand:+ start:15090 stop:16388 length:1299 start_codon:yes stop_codon:yes gene_type:complete
MSLSAYSEHGTSMSDSSKANQDSIVGRLVVEQGLCTSEDVDRALKLRREQSAKSDPNQRSLASILLTKGMVTKKQLERLRPKIEESKSSQQIPGYQIIERLGAGAMATVYKARQLSLDRLVAIKILPQKFTNNPQFVERFYQEGKAAAKLNHPHIVQAIDVGQAAEYHYFVMEYVKGHTVYDDIVKMGKYPEDKALKIIIETSKALEHAHQAGFIHRDVKPKNIMIHEEGMTKLADMGLARAVSDREAAEAEQGKAFGTPYYISPEQIRGKMDIDFRADIYSLGCTFYHMVTGGVPFDGPNPSAVMHKHLKEDVIPPDHLNPSLTAGIGEVIEVCMAKDRDHRYNSTSDLLQDLEALAKGDPPMQARRKFDLASLASLENAPVDAQGTAIVNTVELDEDVAPLTQQPMFWAMVGGWALSVVLLVLLILLKGG